MSDTDRVTSTTRRRFVGTALATGFALTVRPVAAETITTPSSGLQAGEVQIPTSDGRIPAYRARPAGDKPVAVTVE